ncbi:hypothetical protein V500_03307 [Pseudogymnoascus sp. VKM F-4518 (FW-2643)]|nr:hypothetical protein V500_03307 [Pseudogymnoascus sp. VKM F-4518 (FW-2643)]
MKELMLSQECRVTWEGKSAYYLQGIDSEIGRGHDFKIFCNGKIFVIAIRPTGPPDDQIQSVLSRYNSATFRNEDEEEQETQEEIENMIYECAWQTFAPLAPVINLPKPPSDLHSDLNPETFYYRLDLVDGKVGLVQETAPPPRQPFHLAIGDALDLQIYSAKDIKVLQKFPALGYIAKVLANGQEACCKIGTTIHGKAIQREYKCMRTISHSTYAGSIKVPKIIALIADDDDIIGILEEFIPSEYTLARILKDSAAPDSQRRSKWAQQIRQTMYQLHEIGVVWGEWQAR